MEPVSTLAGPDASRAAPEVSVVLPVYNGERSVRAAIRSIHGQTFQDWELLIYDDGSTDASLEICESVAAGDARIHVMRGGVNRGLAAAMNVLVGAASADLIAVQEQDDRSVPERLRLQVAHMIEHPATGVVSGVARWMDGDREVALFPGLLARGGAFPSSSSEMVELLLVEQCKVVNACAMFRRRCLPDGRPAFDEGARMSIDWQFFVDVAHRERIDGIPDVLVEMDRSSTRESLTTHRRLRASEARRFLRIAFRRYLHDSSSPVTRSILRRAWATELNLEGRQRGGLLGLVIVLAALAVDPYSPAIRDSAMEFATRGKGRLMRILTARTK